MKKQKFLALVYIIILLCSLTVPLQITAAGSSEGLFELDFILSAEDKQVITADNGDIITVSFVIDRTDSTENYKTNGFQNYIHYDLSFFELVDESIVCYDTGNATAKRQNSITYGEIIQCQNMGNTYSETFLFCTFQLKVIGTSGSGMVCNDEVYAFDTKYQSVAVQKQNLQVIIDIECTHNSKTKVDAMSSSCNTKGWSAYYDCDSCDAIFDESGENQIPGIPYIDETHSFGDTIVYDDLGHWIECTDCKERSEYSSHNGGVANCKDKAQCTTCGQKYGSIDTTKHSETSIKNKKDTTFWSDGYSGDAHCTDCEELIEAGETISKSDYSAWAWWVWLLFIPIFLLIGCVLIILYKIYNR